MLTSCRIPLGTITATPVRYVPRHAAPRGRGRAWHRLTGVLRPRRAVHA
jgi:hypothetical protein